MNLMQLPTTHARQLVREAVNISAARGCKWALRLRMERYKLSNAESCRGLLETLSHAAVEAQDARALDAIEVAIRAVQALIGGPSVRHDGEAVAL